MGKIMEMKTKISSRGKQRTIVTEKKMQKEMITDKNSIKMNQFKDIREVYNRNPIN